MLIPFNDILHFCSYSLSDLYSLGIFPLRCSTVSYLDGDLLRLLFCLTLLDSIQTKVPLILVVFDHAVLHYARLCRHTATVFDTMQYPLLPLFICCWHQEMVVKHFFLFSLYSFTSPISLFMTDSVNPFYDFPFFSLFTSLSFFTPFFKSPVSLSLSLSLSLSFSLISHLIYPLCLRFTFLYPLLLFIALIKFTVSQSAFSFSLSFSFPPSFLSLTVLSVFILYFSIFTIAFSNLGSISQNHYFLP